MMGEEVKKENYFAVLSILLIAAAVIMGGCSANDQLLLNPSSADARATVNTTAGTTAACEEWTSQNWLHAMYGRATRSYEGSWWNMTVVYTAVGSGELLPGGSYTSNTLHSNGDGVYSLGECGPIVIDDPIYESPAQTIFSGSEMPHTENAVYTDSGRMFVAGADMDAGGKLYEVIQTGDSYYLDVVVNSVNGGFSGLTVDGNRLYATSYQLAATNSTPTLYQIDVDAQSVTVQTRTLNGIKQPNGMAVDNYGRIYISDSAAVGNWLTPSTAPIFRLDSFAAAPQEWLDAEYAQAFPNGIDFNADCSIMYYADANVIYSISVLASGAAGGVLPFYTTDTSKIFDDIAVTDEFVAAAEILSPVSASGSNTSGCIRVIDLEGDSLQTIAPDRLSEPSDILYNPANGELWVTDYFKGGLLVSHRLGLTQ